MTPKEKAKELVDRYVEIIYPIINTTKVKQCTLIAVDEILKAVDGKYEEYWQQVKQEIEKL
jgi:transposase-like protein